MATIAAVVATGNPGLAIGPNGATNPVLQADCSVASAATGIKVIGRAAAAGADIIVASSGTNENLKIDAKGSGTVAINTTGTGAITLGAATGVTGAATVTSTSASAVAVGANGATNPVLKINANTASVATGVEVVGAAAASGVALKAISSGTNEGLTIDAKGSGTVKLGSVSTGAIEFSRNAVPTASDGSALGTTSLMWSDLFLASGGVINFNNGDVTATHSANTLAFAGASTGYTFDGPVAVASSVLSSHATLGLGYATGAGGAVTQLTSRTTGVTVNKAAGAITLVSAAGSTTPASFTVTNSAVAATDVVVLSQKSGTDKYDLSVSAVGAGSFEITFNTKSGTTTEQPVINFAVIKAVAA